MKQEMVLMHDGMKLYVESYLTGKKNTLVFVHGGPGNGCWDFRYAAQRLSEYCNVIMFDQRGVLRSDSLSDEFTSDMLIQDIREICVLYGIDKPVLCGHSYGAQLVLRYACMYPQHVGKLIYLCPSFDFRSSMRNVYKYCLNQAKDDVKTSEIIRKCIEEDNMMSYLTCIGSIPPEIWNNAYHMEEPPERVYAVNKIEGSLDELMAKGIEQQNRIFAEDEINTNYTKLLPYISIPSLIITGELDPVCIPEQKEVFLSNKINTSKEIKSGGHMVYCDAHVDETVQAIAEYIL